jgi:4-amino-4-deoxy-L-arabinose transferase-like glycosyltransferase
MTNDRGRILSRKRMADMRIRVALLLLASTIVILIGQIDRELLPPDDLREVEVAREIYEGGDYIVPHLGGVPFVEKPPGFPAVVATAYRITGKPSAAAARFTAAAFALASLTAVFLLGWRVLGVEGGGVAAAILSFSHRFCRTAHIVLLDNALTAGVAIAVFFTWIALEANQVRKKRLAYTAAGFSLGVSFLFKGFVGPAIFGSGLALYLILSRRFAELRHILGPFPVIAFLVPVLSWVLPFFLQAPPSLLWEFFIANHVGRFHVAYLSHHRPFYYYLLNIWPAFAPGSLLLPWAVWMSWKTRNDWENRAGVFFLAFFIGPLVLLSTSSAKDSLYFLPVYPVLAMLVAWSIAKGWMLSGRSAQILTWIFAAVAILIVGSMVGVTGIRGAPALSVVTASVVFVLSVAGCILSIRGNDLRWTAACIAVLFALGWSLWFTGPMKEAEVAKRSIHPAMADVLRLVGDREIIIYQPHDGFPLDGPQGELSFYRNRTAQKVRTLEALIKRLVENPDKTVALFYLINKEALQLEVNKIAQTARGDVRIEAQIPFARGYLFFVSVGLRKGVE